MKEDCLHDEQDHGICLYCGMDCDPNSHGYGTYAVPTEPEIDENKPEGTLEK